jgi:5'-3' exonuclease
MGIFHFFGWFKKQFSGSIKNLSENQNFSNIEVEVDNLMIDMNGIFHNSAQKIYQYGNFKPKERLLQSNIRRPILGYKHQLKVFEDVCKSIEELLILVNPKKRLILCVDGPAPYAKQVQQKRRRFRSAMDREEDDKNFDSNQITPGTKFMDNLSKYIDWYIRKQISENPLWQNIEVIFSNEKVPSEGEQKLLNYIRNYGSNDESYCIHGADADLIMLSLGVKYSNFYILREDTYDKFNKYFVVDISNVSLQLTEVMRWNSENYEYDPKIAVDDFIFICFMVGNDFLPHIPSLEIIESGIDIILSVYRDVGTTNGHITKEKNGNIYFNKDTLKAFFQVISSYEKAILENKLKNRRMYFEDEILESCAIIEKDNIELDIDKYRKEYCKKYFGEKDMKIVCHDYLKGLHWIISYYRKGVPDWKWCYPYDYAPSATYLALYIDSFIFPKYRLNNPLLPFQQLLCVLPPKSANLLPEPLNKLLINEDSPIKEYYPDNFEIDLAGKKNDWQGVVIVPIIDPDIIVKNYSLILKDIDEKENKRNIFGKTFTYNYCREISNTFNSYYGTIYNCKVKNSIINI